MGQGLIIRMFEELREFYSWETDFYDILYKVANFLWRYNHGLLHLYCDF